LICLEILRKEYWNRLTPHLLRFFYIIWGLIFLVVIEGCSPGKFLINQVSKSLDGVTDIYLTEDDPQLVREAFPFNLKTLELLVQQSPDNASLLTAAASGFALYSYGFILEDADRMAAENIRESRPLYRRARKLLERSYSYGLRALEARHPDFSADFYTNPYSAMATLDKADISAAYWTAAALAGAISASQGDPELLIHLPKVGLLLEFGYVNDPEWNSGAFISALMKYEMSRPDKTADSQEIAKNYYSRVLELTGGNDAAVFVAYAEIFSISEQNRVEFKEMLHRALQVDINKNPQNRLANILAQDRAQWLLMRIDELFYY